MSLLSRALAGADRRARQFYGVGTVVGRGESELATIGQSYSGRHVTEHTAMELVPVYSAVSLLAGAVGSLPLMVYRRNADDSRERASGHWLWRLLHDRPNPAMAADELWEIVTAQLLLWGNAFLLKVDHPVYPVGELWPLRPERVQVGVDDQSGDRFFRVEGFDGVLTPDDILHIRFLGTNGLVGLSPIQQARQMISGSLDQEEFLGRFYANNAHPGGVLVHPNELSREAKANLRADWKAVHGGVRRAGELAILEEGMEWKPTGMPLDDAQFIETARFNLLQVALLFRIPPKMLGAATGDSLTYTSSEWESLDFARWSLRRILVRIEGALMRDPQLFPGRKMYPEFLVEAMLRGTSKERAEFYAQALNPDTGWMRRDEVRALENLEPDPVTEEVTGEPVTDPEPRQLPSGDDFDPSLLLTDRTPNGARN